MRDVIMADLAALSDVTGPAVLNTLLERFKNGQYYTYCGDILLSINPCHQTMENESELGQWYRKSKPLQELPPHVVGLAHRAYRMLVNDVMPQAIVIMGRRGSGKSEAARRIISQLLREARLSPHSGLGPRIIMANQILTTLMSARTLDNADSTRGIKMSTLYYRSDGQMVSAELQAVCMDKWYLTDRTTGCGVFSIFYAMMAGMSDQERGLYYLADRHGGSVDRLLSRNDSRGVFLDREDFQRHVQLFDFFSHCLHTSGIDQTSRNYAGNELSAIFAVLAAILHLGNIDVIFNPQSGRLAITNPHEFASVCDLMAIGQDYLESEILSTSTVVRGQVVRMECSQDQALWNRDVLAVELYRRLVFVVTARLNLAIAPVSHYMDHGPLTPITVVDASPLEHSNQVSMLGIESFFRNMAAERLQHHLYDVIFQRDVEACERERVPPYKIKYTHNTDVISAVFGPDYGIMTKLTSVTLDPQGSPEKLVSLLDNDRSLKKNGSYIHAGKAVKSADVFFLKHTGVGQVTYTARDFIAKNRTLLPESSKQMLLRSNNPVVPVLANVPLHESGFPLDLNSPDAFHATRAFQSDLNFVIQTMDRANLHYIRCVKASDSLTPGHWDEQLLTDQLKECCLVETVRQRKFGFSAVLTQDQFVRSYREMALSTHSKYTAVPDVCKAILYRTGLEGKGVTLSRTSVFLRYWHLLRLHAYKADYMGKIVVAQAQVRCFLGRRRFRQQLRAYRARPGMGQLVVSPRLSSVDPRASGRQGSNLESSPGYLNGSGQYHPGEYPMNEQVDALGVDDDPSGLYTIVIDKILFSLHTLEPSTWAKVIYLERGKQVVKVYVEESSLIIDSSNAEFEGSRLGLGICRNPERDEETAFFRSRIIEGLRLKHDTDDSISACRLSDQPVVVKSLGSLASGTSDICCFSEDVLLNRGHLPLEKTIKIFDMKEFRSKIALDLKQRRFSKAKLRRACAFGLAFGRDDADDTQTPCWLIVVNVRALASLDSEDLVRKAQLYTAELQMTSPEMEEERLRADEAKKRHDREKWSRVDQREHLQAKEEGGRHVRHRLRAKGLSVGEHIGYSWNQNTGGDKPTLQDLQEWVEPDFSLNARRSRHSGQSRDWAKVETVIRDEKNRSFDQSVSSLTEGHY